MITKRKSSIRTNSVESKTNLARVQSWRKSERDLKTKASN